MANALEEIIVNKIKAQGPMPMSEYMALCLGHPEHGYYMTRDPFGQKGDFTTAPEISQMFGELIAAWVMQVWHDMGEPSAFNLVEGGPGRGTLMQDILRTCAHNNAFMQAVRICLIETSPYLKQRQAETLSADYQVEWFESFADIKPDRPVIFIANELLDALPVHQFIKHPEGWRERAVVLNDQDALILAETQPSFDPRLIFNGDEIEPDTIVEICPAAQYLVRDIADSVLAHNGAALFIDYGYIHEGFGDTVQAMQKQKFVKVTDSPGDCDLTAHVNFDRLHKIAAQAGVSCAPLVSQRLFLQNLGIELRAQMLKARNLDQTDGIDSALNRLIGEDEMGNLFKVFGFCHPSLKIAGFENVYL